MNSKQRRKILRAAEAELLHVSLTSEPYIRAQAQFALSNNRPRVHRIRSLRNVRHINRGKIVWADIKSYAQLGRGFSLVIDEVSTFKP